jgi:acid phosphatase family membrane protein YuiD
MTALTEVFVTVKPDTDKFGPEVKKKLAAIDAKKEGSQVAGRFGVGFNGAFGGIVKRSAGLFVGAFAAIKGAQVFGGFIKDAADSARVSRLTAAAIKSTGGAAKITASQVGDLATAISNKSGADDETIQSGANLLLTFTGIRNEVGKGNDIFNQATSTVTDMAAALNGGEVSANGVKAASIQLGKALNNPIKGVTALQKVGVSFTDKQKEQIKTLVESGKTMDAQKIILKELQTEFGGAAAAAGDPFTRLKTIFGNLGEELGGHLLPTAEKFANWVSDKAIPAVSALASLIFKGDFTKGFREAFGVSEDSGFVDFLFRVRDGAIAAFGFFKTEVLPRLKEFGGFLVNTVAPAVAGLVQRLRDELAPAAKDVFGFFKTEVLPRLKDFAGFLNDKVLPPIKTFADKVLASKDFLVPFAAVILTVITAMKAWAVVQGVLNLVMSANPIGLVVIAIAALVGGLIYAYKHSEKFRDILQGAFDGIRKAAQFFAPLVKAAIDIVIGVFSLWWNYYAKPILKAFWEALKFAWERAQDFGRILASVWNAIKEPARAALQYVIDFFLGFIETMIKGAAKAFGWVPGLGDKLKAAATEFGKFRDSVNAKLAGISDQTIKITPVVLAAQEARKNKNANDRRLAGAFATGGGVFGPGSGTSDSIPAMLSNGEHVWTAKEVQKAGGHGAVESMRKAVLRYAKGGPVDVGVKGDFPYFGRSISSIASVAVAVARPIAQTLGNALAKFNPTLDGVLKFVRSQVGKPYIWGGVGPNGYDCSGLISAAINVARGRNPYSRLGATGSMPWSMFASGPGAFEVGWFKGNPGHTAATVNGTNIESAGGVGVRMGKNARGARSSLFTNRAHVKGFANGGRVTRQMANDLGIDTFDTGGRWRSGTLAANTSGRTETVRTAEQEAGLRTPITIPIYIGDEVVRVVRGEIDASGEFTGTVGRMHR